MNRILIITEGTKPDKKIVEHLIKTYKKKEILYEIYTYNTNIYMLYQDMKKIYGDGLEDIQIIPILKSKNKDFEFEKDDFSEIYLFFDYDIHHYKFNRDVSPENLNSQLEEMLNYFSDETGDVGKLYINYPMVEVFFQPNLSCVDIDELKCYKDTPEINGNKGKFMQNSKNFSEEKTDEILKKHIIRENTLINSTDFILPYTDYRDITQKDIFEKELLKVRKFEKIFELNCFPRFIIDYFGEEFYNKKIL